MLGFSKQEEKKPYTYSSIEMRKSSRGYVWWIVALVAIILILTIPFLVSRH